MKKILLSTATLIFYLTTISFCYASYYQLAETTNSNIDILAQSKSADSEQVSEITDKQIIGKKNKFQPARNSDYQNKSTSLDLTLSNIYDNKNLPENVRQELYNKNDITKKAVVNVQFQPRDYCGFYIESSVGNVNYGEDSLQNPNKLKFTTNHDNLIACLKFNF